MGKAGRFFVICSVLVLVFLSACSSVSETSSIVGKDFATDEFGNDLRPIDQEKSTLYFEGSSSKVTERGTFGVWSGALKYKNGVIVGAEGRIEVQSISTASEGLSEHLLTEDFLEVALFPVIEVVSNEIVQTADGKALKAELNLRGIKKNILIPYEQTQKGIKGDFMLGVEDFEISYRGVNNEVRIVFDFVTRT